MSGGSNPKTDSHFKFVSSLKNGPMTQPGIGRLQLSYRITVLLRTFKTRPSSFFILATDNRLARPTSSLSTADGGWHQAAHKTIQEIDMTHKIGTLGFAVLLVVSTAMLPLVKADQWNEETSVTFSAPVAVPGQVLPPGRYVFKLTNGQNDRNTVQILTEDHREVLATIPAIPAYRLNLTEDTIMTFKERPSGSPEAVSRWFYPGHLAGVAFVYPEDQR
jgi:hypothetical protein